MNSAAKDVEQSLHTRDPVVLVVDDDPLVLNAVRRCFRDDPFEVITARSCDEALAWASEVPVGLVIADQVMPGMNGTELIAAIRSRHPGTPCALLTGFRTWSVVRRAADAHAAAVLDKPWSDRLLRETALRLLGRTTDSPEHEDSTRFDMGREG